MNQTSSSKKHKRISRSAEVWHRLKKNKGAMVGLAIVVILTVIALTADLWIDYDTQVIMQSAKDARQHPSAEHIMGTDQYGRDIFYRLLYGTRYSLAIGVVAVIVSMAFGIPLGAIAGYYGGRVDNIIMRVMDILNPIPLIMMGIVIVSALGASVENLMLAVGITAVPGFVRIVRAAILTTCNQEYVEAARAMGLSQWKIIFGHVLPNCLSSIIVYVTLRIGSSIIAGSSLSFLSLGVPAPAPEWGGMLSEGRNFIRGYGYMTFFPGLAIMITVLAFNMIGDGLRDALDPKLKR